MQNETSQLWLKIRNIIVELCVQAFNLRISQRKFVKVPHKFFM